MTKALFFLSLLLLFSGITSGQNKINGIVFLDINKNGKKDSTEKGLRNISVSNGDTIVMTDKNGKFSFPLEGGISIFPILPSNYRMSFSSIGNACFKYIGYSPVDEKSEDIIFPVNKIIPEDNFRIGAVGDIQVGDREEINYANQTIIPELASRSDLAFNIFLGDLVNDESALFPELESMLKNVASSVWTVYGNHDRVAPGNNQDKAYNEYFGASHYAFNYGEVHFIVLNNVWSDGTRKYEGRITDQQLRFVNNDLALVPKSKLVVICQHIPMVYTKNKDQLLAMLEKRGQRVLFLSGHTHQVSRHQLGENIDELVVGASCGNWWVGEKDWQGIPTALMQCGAPRNYFVVDFSKDKYSFSFKGIGLDENRQMDIWVAGQDSLDCRIAGFSEYKRNEVIANIYGGGDSTKVRLKIGNGLWIPMKKMLLTAPNVSRLSAMNKIGNYPSGFSRKAALRNSPSSHIWVGYLPAEIINGVQKIQIEANDKFFHAEGIRFLNFPSAKQ